MIPPAQRRFRGDSVTALSVSKQSNSFAPRTVSRLAPRAPKCVPHHARPPSPPPPRAPPSPPDHAGHLPTPNHTGPLLAPDRPLIIIAQLSLALQLQAQKCGPHRPPSTCGPHRPPIARDPRHPQVVCGPCQPPTMCGPRRLGSTANHDGRTISNNRSKMGA